MEQMVTIPLPRIAGVERTAPVVRPEVSEIREIFHEMNCHGGAYQPAPAYITAKRVLDLAVSSLILVGIMSWLLPVVALLIKLTSRGPVFFIQKRTGHMGVEFNCYKFRTMYVNDEAHTQQAVSNDKRITPVGKFLRLTHLDETAQIFNIFLGDMTLVGPRPHMLYHTDLYGSMIPYYHLRHEVVPGLTGMAQIKGYIGEISGERELRKRVQWDIYYLKNRSILLDLKIITVTFLQVFRKAFQSV